MVVTCSMVVSVLLYEVATRSTTEVAAQAAPPCDCEQTLSSESGARDDSTAVCVYNALSHLRSWSELKAVASYKQLGQEINGENLSDELGNAVKMNEDGSRVIVGAKNTTVGRIPIRDINSL
jgi:hypothetical protein